MNTNQSDCITMPSKVVGWVIFVVGWITFVIGDFILPSWVLSNIEDPLVKALVFIVVFFGFAFLSIILIAIGSRMAGLNWKVPDYGGWD